jgi:hypothetical protein
MRFVVPGINSLLWIALGCVLTSHALGADAPVRTYCGLCDASAAVWLNAQTFAVANDEDNAIRVYSSTNASAPLSSVDLSGFLQADSKKPEVDIEGAATLGDLTFWISSHGRNASGKERTSRYRFFATRTIVEKGVPYLAPTGLPYSKLLNDLTNDPELKQFELAAAATLPPKAPGGLNIEGLAATPEGHLLIGFRNPIPKGNALLVPLLNPAQVIAGAAAKLGPPILVPLKNNGIRSITEWRGSYLIVAGSFDGEGKSALYQWPGPGRVPEHLTIPGIKHLNPEALALSPDPKQTDLLVISDDGNVMVGGKPCKKLKQANQRCFRAVILPDFKP